MRLLREYFWIDGERSDDHGIYLQAPLTFTAATPNITTVSVPGRNGDLHIFDGSFSNVEGTAKCFALRKGEAKEAVSAISRWVLSTTGYRRLVTSDDPEIFREAVVTAGPETEIRMRTLAPFSIKFNCKPQRFFLSGENTETVTASGAKLWNPGLTSQPKLTVYGSGAGTVTIGDTTVKISDIDGYVELDSETQNAYKGGENKNGTITALEFPTFAPGENEITFTGGVTKIDIIPRWWTL
jgi:phage-related protein